MINRRSLLLGAAAVAVAPAAATALPARAFDADACAAEALRYLDAVIPCDGRPLPISQYLDLFEVLKPTCSWSYDTQSFRVPDLRGRARVFDAQGLLARPDATMPITMYIGTGHGQLPAGVVIPMVINNG